MPPAWRPYPALPASTVTGDLRQLDGVFSPQLGNTRHLLAWLPPTYDSSPGRRFPVVYMHDGQNLFDAATGYAGEWRADESLTALATEGLEAIVVGIPNAGPDGRGREYSAHRHPILGGGRATDYVRFLAETVKPLVDATLRTRPGRDDTTVAGSSLGGLVSLQALFERPDVFSRAGVFSPAFWWTQGTVFPWLDARPKVPGRIYLDVGGREEPRPEEPRRDAYREDFERAVALLRAKGYGAGELKTVFEPEAIHHEDAWAARFPDAMRFLLG